MAMQPSLARLLRGYRAVLGVSDMAMLQIASMDTHRQTDEQNKRGNNRVRTERKHY